MDRAARLLLTAATGVAVTAIIRQRREAAATTAGRRSASRPPADDDVDAPGAGIHGHLASWHPERPRTVPGRVAAALWAAPLTAIGVLVTVIGGTVPAWHSKYGTFVALDVRGPARWFLQSQSATAATLGQAVVVRDGTASHRLLVHEATHARQQERLGPLFALLYPLASAGWGYRRNPFEVAARAVARGVSEPAGSS